MATVNHFKIQNLIERYLSIHQSASLQCDFVKFRTPRFFKFLNFTFFRFVSTFWLDSTHYAVSYFACGIITQRVDKTKNIRCSN